MIRTRAMLVSATAAACLAGVAAGSIGAAQATSTGTTGTTGATSATATATPATVTVNGAAIATVDTTTDVATQHAAYLTALGNAVTDAKTKAGMLATQVGDTLGAVQSLTEQSSFSGGNYCGRVIMGAAGYAKGAPSVAPSRRPSKKKTHHTLKLMAAIAQPSPVGPTTCTIEADVTATFSMG